MSAPQKIGLGTAAVHLALILALAAYIARQTRYDGETPMVWLLAALLDFPVSLATIPLASHIMTLPHVSWMEHPTGEWITGEGNRFLRRSSLCRY